MPNLKPKGNRRARNGQGSIYEATYTDKRTGQTLTRWQGQVVIPQELGPAKRKTVYGQSYAEVKSKMAALQRQVAEGTAANTAQTVEGYLANWLRTVERTIQPTTLEQYRLCVHNHLVPRIGAKRLDKLTPLQVQRLISEVADAIAAKGQSKGVSTANRCRRVLYMALKQAVRWQLLARNPVEAVNALPETPRDMKLWEPAEAARFLAAAQAHRLYAAFYLAMSTGLRRGELLGLRWCDIDGHRLHIRQTIVKKADGTLLVKTPKSGKGCVLKLADANVGDGQSQRSLESGAIRTV
jgi:hypothetical protein